MKLKKRLNQFLFVCISAFIANAVNASDIDFENSLDLYDSALSLSLEPAINSTINIEQLGSHNNVIAAQSGYDNQMQVTQHGDSNEIIAIQYGESNELNVNQFGDNNKADVYQFGSYNSANITQSGNQYFLLEQYGDFGVVNITQF